MTWTTQNPPPLTNPYDYSDKDKEQIAAIISNYSGNTSIFMLGLIKQEKFPFTSTNKTRRYLCILDLVNNQGLPLNTLAYFVKFVFEVPKTYNLTGNEKVTMLYGNIGAFTLRSFYLADVMKINANGTYDAYCTGEISIDREYLSSLGGIYVTIDGINPAQSVQVFESHYYYSSGEEKSETPTNIARYQNTVFFQSNVSGADLCNQINAYKAANPSYLIVDQSFTQHINNDYSAFITVIR